MLRSVKIVLINLLTSLVLLELVLQVVSIWVEPDKVAAQFSEDKNVVRVLALGDSNTYGLYLEPHQAWPKQWETIWNSTQQQKISVLNLGYPGTNTVRVEREIDNILKATNPDLVVMMLGGNDFWTASLPEDKGNKDDEETLTTKILGLSRIYKILDLLLKENLYKDDIRYRSDQIYMDLAVLPRNQGIRRLKKFLIESNLNIVCTDASDSSCEAVHGDNKVGLVAIYERMLAAKDVEVRVDEEYVFSGPVDSMMATLALIIMQDLGYPTRIIPGEYSTGSAVLYKGYEFILGANVSSEGVSENIRLRMIRNYGRIKQAVEETGAALVILNYHNNTPINRDLRDVSKEHHIPLININRAINNLCDPGNCPELLFSDGHPKVSGQKFIAERVGEYFIEHPFCDFLQDHLICH